MEKAEEIIYNHVLDNLIEFGFSRMDTTNKGYVTREDIKTKYSLSEKDLDIIMDAFDPRRKNRIRPKHFKKMFKFLVDNLY